MFDNKTGIAKDIVMYMLAAGFYVSANLFFEIIIACGFTDSTKVEFARVYLKGKLACLCVCVFVCLFLGLCDYCLLFVLIATLFSSDIARQ